MGQIFFLTIFLFQILALPTGARAMQVEKHINAIYGVDDRKFVDEHSPAMIQRLSQSVAMIVSKDLVEKNLLWTTILANKLSDGRAINLCKDEKFADHHSVNSCTGFLIGDDLVATAGHCFQSEYDCSNKLVAFNVLSQDEMSKGYRISNRNVYECKEIVSRILDFDHSIDYAVIRLKRKVIGKKILKLRAHGSIALNDNVFMIGHPLGLPQIFTNSAKVNDNRNLHFFKASLDSFEGNSGSPVFNSKTFEVEGILVRGEDDFFQDESLHCSRDQVYDQITQKASVVRGEGVTRIKDILPSLAL